MLSIPRSVARLVRATFRKAGDTEGKSRPKVLSVRSDDSGLRIQSQVGLVGIEYRIDGEFPKASFDLPFEALADIEGTMPTPVQFSIEADGKVRAEWPDAGVPQQRLYGRATTNVAWLEPPAKLHSVGNGSVVASLSEAMQCAAAWSIKFALTKIQLRGKRGEIVGSDGRQLLVLRGFDFPWKDDILVPRTRLFEAKAIADAESVEMASADGRLVVRAGPWTVWLTIDAAGRFPNVDHVIPRPTDDATRIVFTEDDAEFLTRSLPRLPHDEDRTAVTIHANGHVVIRAKAEALPTTELVLSGSRVAGPERRLNVDRDLLRRAVQLGIRSVRLTNDRTPVVGEGENRLFVFQPLDSKSTLGPSDDAVRIDSANPLNPTTNPQPLPRHAQPMNEIPNGNRHDEPEVETSDEVIVDPLQEADALRVQLRETLGRVNRLVHALKRQRRQAQLVRSTLASLKQLQEVA